MLSGYSAAYFHVAGILFGHCRPAETARGQKLRASIRARQPGKRPRAQDHRLRPLLRSRRGALPLGCQRGKVSRPARRLRRVRPGPQSSRGPPRAGGFSERGLSEFGKAGGAAAVRPAGGGVEKADAEPARHGFLHQLRRGGRGDSAQIRPLRDGQAHGDPLQKILPRADLRRAFDQRRR